MQSTALNNFAPIMHNAIKDKLSKTTKFDTNEIFAVAFNIAWLFIVGKRAFQCKEDVAQYYMTFREGLRSVSYDLPGSSFRKALQARAKICKVVTDFCVNDPTAKTDTDCCLSGLMTGTLPEIEQRVMGLLFAAFETLTMSVNGLLWCLVNNPQVIEKLKKEIRETDFVPMTVGDFLKFPYTNKVIHENLRLFGSDFVSRKNKVPLTFKNYTFPKDTAFLIHTGQEHHQISNPSQFDPDREDKYRWEPFGTGPRNCQGKVFAQFEMKMIVYHLIKDFDITIEKDKNAMMGLDNRVRNARLLLKPVQEIQG